MAYALGRIVAIATDPATQFGVCYAKEGDVGAAWTNMNGVDEALGIYVQDVVMVSCDGARFAVLTNLNTTEHPGIMYLKDGALSAAWQIMNGGDVENIIKIQLADGRIAALSQAGILYMKIGVDDAWTTMNGGEVEGIVDFLITRDIVAVRTHSGKFLLKRGGLGEAWIDMTGVDAALSLNVENIKGFYVQVNQLEPPPCNCSGGFSIGINISLN